MPDSDLTKETREALLTAIKADAEGAGGERLHHLAAAFALTVGANVHKLPGYLPPSSS
ncbi:hypothetical protein [Mycobacteroides abscessus]|uniref:Uncharacterized protein n=1 Tax=Mycobacteroides abscessus subsp. massiliense TaxID=1962118 RepID=A0A1U5PMU3_9MYCO|nr:hypothetical protein [Mycobacteroides abscessus]MDO3110067.1 hypothetical protein [Mycobacteroides abscessus subsp. abscessus]SKF66663.1 Uncharacterised protein [Mycobacteroides abscessus subsp. bolletii]SKF71812.1 Uncharacterised protein [Mycobacteroides abscessus subsp. bolletii]SKL37632.1 Uncharacterised protein [Mycobacteroides abscessus subsp. massiliense]SKS56536.1 Uncharacterised protein [Mycobacteroides abscessus subsp. massiliense]